MTKQRPETKFEVFFYGILLSPLGFRAIIDVIIAAAAYWNGYYS